MSTFGKEKKNMKGYKAKLTGQNYRKKNHYS